AWATVFARAGYQVALYDAKPGEVRDRALPGVRATLDVLAQSGALSEPVQAIMERVHDAGSISAAVAGAIYVPDSGREDAGIKRQVFAEISAAASAEAILASSTSAIRGSEFLGGIAHPERALVAHPVNPPSLIPLVELCPTPQTSSETVSAAGQLLTQAGM